MMRISTIAGLLIATMAVSGCQTIHIERARAIDDAAWPVDGQTQRRDRTSEHTVMPPLELAWEYNAAAGFGPGSPLIIRDQVLVANRKGELHAIDLESGKRSGYKVFNDAIEATPIFASGRLYMTSAWGNRSILAFDADRSSIVWRVDDVPVEVPVIADGDMVLAVDVEAVVHAYDAADGSERWQIRLGDRMSVQSAPLLVAPGRLFVATDTGRMVLVDTQAGRILWQVDSGLPVYASPAANDARIVVPTTRGVVLSLDPGTGDEHWRYDSGMETARMSGVALAGPRVLFGSTDTVVRQLDAVSGRVQWETGVNAVISAPPQLTPGMVWVGTMGRELIGLNGSTGKREWSTELKGRIKSAMATTEGSLIVLIEPRYVLKFDSIPNKPEPAP